MSEMKYEKKLYERKSSIWSKLSLKCLRTIFKLSISMTPKNKF